MNIVLATVSVALLFSGMSISAQTSPQQSATGIGQSKAAPLVDGEVRKVDKDAGKIILKHGPIPNLEMPGMTMVFRVKDTSMLDTVQAGDTVRFSADKIDGQFTVMTIEVSK